MTRRKPFKITCQEENRGPEDPDHFATLAEASKWIQGRWQGPDYMDGNESFHNDFAIFRLYGFKLSDIGTKRAVFPKDKDGVERFSHMEFTFKRDEDLDDETAKD